MRNLRSKFCRRRINNESFSAHQIFKDSAAGALFVIVKFMYKTFTAADYKKYMKLPADYEIAGFVIYGTYRKYPYEQFAESLKRLGHEYKKSELDHEFFNSVAEFEVEGKKYWLTTAYGGAILSEFLHLACLFGSKKNILLGSCGGLKKGATNRDLLVPEWSFAEESSAKAYQPEAGNKYAADETLSKKLAETLAQNYTVHRGPTVTYQAMMGETWEDIQNWSNQGFIGVEMEAATVFSASKYFKVPAAAILRIDDNLIEDETVMDINYESMLDERRQLSQSIFDTAVKEVVS